MPCVNDFFNEFNFWRKQMKEIRNSEKFSFLYGGENMQSCSPKISKTVNGNKTVTVYDFDDGLRVTNVLTEYEKYGAVEWINYFENNYYIDLVLNQN